MPDQLTPEVGRLLSDPMNCAAPCLFGARPGMLTARDTLAPLEPYNFLIYVIRKKEDRFSLYERQENDNQMEEAEVNIRYNPILNTVDHKVVYTFDDQGILKSIHFGFAPPADEIIQRYGLPDEVWLYSWKNMNQSLLPVDLGFYYFDLGLGVVYRVYEANENDGYNIGCFDGLEGRAELIVPKSAAGYKDLSISNQEDFQVEQPIWDVTDLDPETFMTMFTDPRRPKCIQTLASHWDE